MGDAPGEAAMGDARREAAMGDAARLLPLLLPLLRPSHDSPPNRQSIMHRLPLLLRSPSPGSGGVRGGGKSDPVARERAAAPGRLD